MIALFKKEISVFFSTLIGYLIIGIFLLINSILLWSDFSDMNILSYGYADMDIFFTTAPLFFLLFIPAVSMRVFTEEYSSGNIENLITKPITSLQIVLAKFLAIFGENQQLQIAMNKGTANTLLGLKLHEIIRIEFK